MKKVLIIVIFVLLCAFLANYVYATSLLLEVKADKETVEIGENVTITVDWNEKMQAADYILKYNSSKLEYVSASIEDTYLNKTQKGQIGISWFSSNNQDLTQMTFVFKAIEKGDAELSVQIDGGFSDGQLNVPGNYDVTSKGRKTITLIEKINEQPEQKPEQTPEQNQNPEQKPQEQPSQNPEQKPEQEPGGQQPTQSPEQQSKEKTQPNNPQKLKQDTLPTQLPKTGDKYGVLSIIIVSLIILSVIFVKQYRKYKGVK